MTDDVKRTIFIARKLFAELVYDVQALEGMPFTMPEVETYLQGVTVGGHKVTDEAKLKQQAMAWERLIDLVETGAFAVDKATACGLQAIVAKDEALETGRFRSGMVGIAGTDHRPPAPKDLEAVFETTIREALAEPGVLRQGCRLHLDFARNQFFFDGNKRTGLLMANGRLMSHGLAPLSIPAKRLVEYNAGMLRFYDSDDRAEMTAFLRSCHDNMSERFGLPTAP